jgi:D-galactarolactone cycloisomerase
LKITAIRVERLRLPLDPPFYAAWDPDPRRSFEATIVRVETDSGLVGVGSGDTMNGIDDFVQLFVGRDALAIERHARVLETVSFHAGRFWPLEAALWDLFGQACGQPVAALLGGALDALPAYASWGSIRDPGQRVEDALALVEEGFRAVKIRIAPARADEGIGVVAAVRDAVGDRLEIMVDLNQWWRMAGDIGPRLDVGGARRIVERLRSYGVLWVEEPLPGEGVVGMRSRADRWRRDGADVRRAAPGVGCRCVGRVSARCGAGAGYLGCSDAGGSGAAAEPVVHAPHVDQRDRRARQPARVRGGRRRAVP